MIRNPLRLLRVKPLLILGCVLAQLTFCHAAIGQRLGGELTPPAGHRSITATPGSYGEYLADLSLRADSAHAVRYNGRPAYECCHGYRIVDLGFLFNQDLEQCADMGYRLFAEYCRASGHDDAIDFKLQNGQHLSWPQWRAGNRLRYDPASDKHVSYQTSPDSSRTSFKQYLRYLFTWTGSWAALKYLLPVSPDSLQPGDMIVQNRTGGMGHLSIIFAVCENDSGDKLYLIGSGWTPAQEIIIHNPAPGEGNWHWFTLEGYRHHLAAFDFGSFNFRRFPIPRESG